MLKELLKQKEYKKIQDILMAEGRKGVFEELKAFIANFPIEAIEQKDQSNGDFEMLNRLDDSVLTKEFVKEFEERYPEISAAEEEAVYEAN